MEIKLKEVTKKLKGTTVIDHVTMELNSACVYGLCGYNGSGKTMLMRLIAGLIYPTSGTVTINGKVLGKEIDFPESIGLLLENPAFLEEHTAFRNLLLLTEIRHTASERIIRETLHRAGLDANNPKPYQKYSLGMKQRLGIAAAIVEQPDLILLDEPTNALDTEGVDMLKTIIREERERGALVVLASHDGEFLKSVSDRICRVEKGHLKEWKELS